MNEKVLLAVSGTLALLFAAGLYLLSAGQSVDGAAQAGTAISAETLRELMATDPKLKIVDVRTPEEFTGPLGHLPEARNIPLNTLSKHIDELNQPDQTLVLVCRTQNRSARGAMLLERSGISNVLYLQGGMTGWRQQ